MKMDIKSELYNYFYNHPALSMDDFLVIANEAYEQARKSVIPIYKPKRVASLQSEDEDDLENDYESSAEYEDFEDESTFSEDN